MTLPIRSGQGKDNNLNGHLTAADLLHYDQHRRDSMPPNRPHDPEVCGLAYATSCPDCQAEFYRDQIAQLDGAEAAELVIERFHRLLLTYPSVLDDGSGWDRTHPKPLPPHFLAALVFTLLLPRHRALFREVFLELLRPGADEPGGACSWMASRQALRPILLDILGDDIARIVAKILNKHLSRRNKRRSQRDAS
jgi:hypothetical protein